MTKLKLEMGKYYRTRDGRKVGPMEANYIRPWNFRCGVLTYRNDGCWDDSFASNNDLITEWTDTPTLKVGDKVKVVAGYGTLFNGRTGIVTHVEGDDAYVASKSNLPKDYHQGDDFHLYFWGRELEPIPTIGTLAEIGAQVGDVVEFVEWADGNRESGMFAVGKQYTHTGDRLDSGRGYFLMADAVNHKFRIISRASDVKSPVELAMEQGESTLKADKCQACGGPYSYHHDCKCGKCERGPVIIETTKRIVPGVYGKVYIHGHVDDGCDIYVRLTDETDDRFLDAFGCAVMSRDDLTAAIATLTAIRDAL